MERSQFLSEVTETYFNTDLNVTESIVATGEKLNVSEEQITEWFGRDLYAEKVESCRRTVY